LKLKSISVNPFIVMFLTLVLILFNTLFPMKQSYGTSSPVFKHTGTLTLNVGETYQLEVKNKPKNSSMSWHSDKKAVVKVDENGKIEAISEGIAKIYCTMTYSNNKTKIIVANISVKEVPMKLAPVPVNEYGLDSSGRMVAYFGSPVIDGQLDPVWKNAQAVVPKIITGETDTTATFKALWDDKALYILAEVKDKHLSVSSGTPYMQDSVEVFLDELNDKASEYGPDDMHIRINYENSLSVDNGNADLYYSAAKKIDGGYAVEIRVALKSPPKNGTVLGIELQVNDAKGTERIATINLFDHTSTAWNNPSTFGEIILTGKNEKDVSGVNPYDLLNLIKSTLKMNFKLYKNSEILINAINQAVSDSIIRSEGMNQAQIDKHYDAIKKAISQLEMTEEAANEKYFTPTPDEYRMESDQPGKIETLHYKTANLTNELEDKKLHVYLPYNYDATDKNKKYNVLYLMHGGGENEDLLFGGPGENRELKKIIDNMIAKGDIEPLIVVTPSFYGGKGDVAVFHEELLNDIIPLVETKYNTHTQTGSLEDIKASREHRAFGGFSMGSVTTWYTFIHALDYVKYYIPLSGDSWIIEQAGGGKQPEKTAQYLADVVKKSGYTAKDYYIFSATGNLDIAYPNLKPQIDAMKKLDDVFIYSSNTDKGNFYFIDADGGTHAWNWQNQYIYDILPDLFVNE